MTQPTLCRSCRQDAGLFGKDPRARHACSYDKADHKVRSINWMELEDAFVITHANGVKLAKSDWVKTPRGCETRFNGFLLRCPRTRPEQDAKVNLAEMMAEKRERGAKMLRNGGSERN